MKLSKNRLVNILFIISLIGIVFAIGYLSYSSTKTAEINKPYLIAYSQEQGVVFNIDKTLYHTDINGHTLASKSLESLGLDEALGDIEIVDDYLLVTQGRLKNILKCPLPFSTCQEIATLSGKTRVEALDIAVTPDKKHFYISSSKAHKIDYYTIDGEHIYELNLNENLNYPNGIVAFNEGELVVADTNNHRIIGIKHKNSIAKVVWEMPVESTLTRDGFVWPTTLEIASDKRLWVVNLDGFFEYGDIVIYEKITQPFEEVDENIQVSSSHKTNDNVVMFNLPKNAQPKTIKAIENGMLIGDASSFKIIQTDLSGVLQKEFGDTKVIEEFRKVGEEKEFWDLQIVISQVLIALFTLLLIVSAIIEYMTTKDKSTLFTQTPEYQMSEKLSEEKKIIPDANGIIWLRISATYFKKIKLLVLLLAVLVFVTAGLLLYIDSADETIIYILVGLSLFSTLAAWFVVTAFSKIKIGVKGSRIYLHNAFSQSADDDVQNIEYSRTRVIVKGVSVAIKDGHGSIFFDEAEFSEYILPLLKDVEIKSEMALLFEKLKAGDLKTWLGTVSSGAIIVAIFLYEFYLQ